MQPTQIFIWFGLTVTTLNMVFYSVAADMVWRPSDILPYHHLIYLTSDSMDSMDFMDSMESMDSIESMDSMDSME